MPATLHARPSGMGETYAGVAGDVNAIYWNPAGLAGMERRELTMTHALWLEDITYTNLACALPMLGGTVGAGFNVLNTGDIQKADNTGLRLADKYSMSDMMGLVSYARGWGDLALGANLKYISSQLEEESARSFAADIGALYTGFRPWDRNLGVGFSVQNIGTKAKYVSEEYPMPVMIRAGGALRLFKSLLVASDLNYTEKDADIHAGAEYTRGFGAAILALRGGYKTDTVKELGALSGLTLGFGVKWSDLQFDYAWNSFTDLGITHRISLAIKFGGLDADKDGVPNYLDKCTDTPAKAPVDAAGCPLDTDKDGVADHLDKCHDTPAGTAVDAAGCPLDGDKDGVADYLDTCPGTPIGTAVDAAGCPLDSDKDGVADYLDKCPDTSTSAVVNADGCPLDSDKDGVPDYLDKCPDTSTAAVVDLSGCPVDNDKDGVADYLDECPGTSTGTAVNAAGCPVISTAEVQALDRLSLLAMPGSVTEDLLDAVRNAAGDPACPWEQVDKFCMKLAMEFDYDKAELKGDFAPQLKNIAAFMGANPGARIELQGCTDEHGTDDYNIRLSGARANAVMKHLIDAEGLAAGRLSAKGIGKTSPVADNQTEEGRQRNRRVIAILTFAQEPTEESGAVLPLE